MRDHITRCLAQTSLPDDPVDIAQRSVSSTVLQVWFRTPLQPAAVLVPLIERDTGLTVLLTVRHQALPDHPGQIAFPGGRPHAADADLRTTALREAEEEIGLKASQVELIGNLDVQAVITGYAVVPMVGFVSGDFQPVAQPEEVEEIFEVPLDFLLERRNGRRVERSRGGVRLATWEYRWRDYEIWGATAQMLRGLLRSIETGS